MPKGLQVHSTGSGIAGGGQIHKFLDDGSVVIGSGSAAAGVDNKAVVFFDSANGAGDVTIHGALSASVNISASAYYGDGSTLDNVSTSVAAVADSADYHFAILASNAATSAASFYVENDNVLKYNPNNDELMLSGTLTATDVSASYLSSSANLDVDGNAQFNGDLTVKTGGTVDFTGATLTIDNDAISGDKVEGGTIVATTITTLTSTDVNSTNVSGSTKLATARLEDAGGALTIDAGVIVLTLILSPSRLR